eukprot:TRINITY_DN1214_c0_g1_i2.p1 TRINITY_DN1214_c0_g1~~TRINITY_DN1214_c0_g1_i2.p1  ORF type:complete len:469 (+),score=73.80 TRINITY_DN1214_c0_g1_i2:177-1583(+)
MDVAQPKVVKSNKKKVAKSKPSPAEIEELRKQRELKRLEKQRQQTTEHQQNDHHHDHHQHQHQHGSLRWKLISPYPSTSTTETEVNTISTIRLFTFNLLAPATVRRDMFPHCNQQCLKWPYRRALILRLLQQSKADVICLQECDEATFNTFFNPEMEKKGYRSHFILGGKHGIAILYDSNKFEELQYKEIFYAKIITEGRTDLEYDELNQRNFGQVLALKLINSTGDNAEGIIVTNTHLFWNWKYQFVKLKQMEALLRELHSVKENLNIQGTFHSILAGDYNMCPDNIAYKVITGVPKNEIEADDNLRLFLIPDDHCHANSNDLDKVTNDGINATGWSGYKRAPVDEFDYRRLEEVKQLLSQWYEDKTLPTLFSAYGNYTKLGLQLKHCPYWDGEPPYTCFGPSWTGTLDYIFTTQGQEASTSKLVLKSIMELPTVEELTVQTALPNDFIPSDHMPLMAEFVITSTSS